MPDIVLNPNDTNARWQTVSDEQYRTMKRAASDREESFYAVVDDSSTTLRLWDVIDQSWTRPLPATMLKGSGQSNYLSKTVYVCSACPFTTSFAGGVAKHVNSALGQYESHKDATIDIVPNPVTGMPQQVCTGCGETFASRPGQGARHLEGVIAGGPKHRRADELLVKRFNLDESEAVILSKETVTSGDITTATGAEEWSGERRTRKRRRSRSRRRGHGNG